MLELSSGGTDCFYILLDSLLSSTGAELLSREREAEQQFVEAGCELNRQLLRQPGAALVSALCASIVCLVGEHFHALVCSSPYQRVVVCTLAGAAWELVGWLLTGGKQLCGGICRGTAICMQSGHSYLQLQLCNVIPYGCHFCAGTPARSGGDVIIRCELVVGRLTASSFPEYIAHEHPTDIYFCTHAEGVQHLCCGCQAYGSAGQVNATNLDNQLCLDLQAYLHVQWLGFQHVSAYSLRTTSGNTKD